MLSMRLCAVSHSWQMKTVLSRGVRRSGYESTTKFACLLWSLFALNLNIALAVPFFDNREGASMKRIGLLTLFFPCLFFSLKPCLVILPLRSLPLLACQLARPLDYQWYKCPLKCYIIRLLLILITISSHLYLPGEHSPFNTFEEDI